MADVDLLSGPYDSFGAFYKGMLEVQLKDAERSSLSAGWHRDGLRERIDKFAKGKFAEILEKIAKNEVKKCLIIGDMSTSISYPAFTRQLV